MRKLGLKMNITGWIVFAVSFIVTGSWHEWVGGIATGMFISSIWVTLTEYKNQ